MDSSIDALRIINALREAVDIVEINGHQCRRLADRIAIVGNQLKLYESNVGSEVHMSTLPSPLESFLSLLKKAKYLVAECGGMHWVTRALIRGNNREAFEEIHIELDKCKTFTMGDAEDFDRKLEEQRAMLLRLDAEVDRQEILKKLDEQLRALQENPTEDSAQSVENLENIRTVISEKFEEANDKEREQGLPSYLQIAPSAIARGEVIGVGSYGMVLQANWLGCNMAVKNFPWSGGYSERWFDEAMPLIKLRHPHVVQLVEFSPSIDDKEWSVLMELMDGDLRGLIDKRMDKINGEGEPFTRVEAIDIISQIARGLSYVHRHGYMHGDRVLSMNILVKEYGDYIDVKIGDLGVPQDMKVEHKHVHEPHLERPRSQATRLETARWMAPEICTSYEGRTVYYSPEVDIYSFGMACFEILTGKIPFSDCSDVTAVHHHVLAGERPQLPNQLDENLDQLIRQCWHVDSTLRPTAERISYVLDLIKFSRGM